MSLDWDNLRGPVQALDFERLAYPQIVLPETLMLRTGEGCRLENIDLEVKNGNTKNEN